MNNFPTLCAEQAVLGSLLLDNTTWDEIGDYLQIEDFSSPLYRDVFRTIGSLIVNGKNADIICVAQNLKNEKGEKNDESLADVAEIAQSCNTPHNIKSYAEIVKQSSLDRKLIHAAQNIIFSVNLQKENRLDYAQKNILEIANQIPSDINTATDILKGVLSVIDERQLKQRKITGLSTGFYDLDKITSGLQGGDLIILAGRPSMGKTLLAMNIAEHASIEEKNSAIIFSLEMSSQQLIERSLVSVAKINASKLKSGTLDAEDLEKISHAVPQFHDVKLFIDDRASLSVSDIRAKCRRIKREYGLSLVVIDYITLMAGDGENETIRISNISRGLKLLARDLNVPVIAISQLNRSVEQRNDKRPYMADLRQSGGIEQDADLILFIYRDEVYNKESHNKGIAEIIIAKHRNGEIGTVNLAFNSSKCAFSNLQGNTLPSYQERQIYTRKAFPNY